MATAQDLLDKAEARRKKVPFTPEKRRSWDYSSKESANLSVIPTELKANLESNNTESVVHGDSSEEPAFSTASAMYSPKIATNAPAINAEQISEQNGNKYRNIIRNNSEQSRNEIRNNQEQISEQSGNTNGNGIRNKTSAVEVISHPVKPVKLSVESVSLPNETTESHILTVLRKTTGHQKKIMEQLTAHVKVMKEIINVINIPISTLSERINTDADTIRTSIKRLQKKSILLRSQGERGRHGNTQVIMPSFVVKECFNLFNCVPQSLDEIGYKNGNENRNDTVYSSSNYININTTKNEEISENWLNINFEPLTEIGFSATQLKQLSSKSLNTPDVVQESIHHFAFGLANNPKFKKYSEPLNVLMGVLRKGQAWVEQNYQSPQEIAQRELIERKKAERERIKKLEEETYTLAFEEWLDTLSAEKTEEIAPAKPKDGLFAPQRVRLSAFFRENIWELKKAEYLKI